MRCGKRLPFRGGGLIVLGCLGLVLYTFKILLLVFSVILIVMGILTLT